MGIDPASFRAKLHLYAYEYKFIKLLMGTDKRKAMKFRFATRFIDDECNLNDGGEFGRSFQLIYSSDLELKCEHQGTRATFLDLEINISDGIFVYKLFDKRDSFPFFIVRMPNKSGNIPSHFFTDPSCRNFSEYLVVLFFIQIFCHQRLLFSKA